MNIERYELTDEQWNQIKNLFPKYRTGRPPKSNRTMFNAVLWIARSGAAWRDFPKERYGSWKTVYSRFCLWRDTELLESLFITLNSEADYENKSIDSYISKIHAIVDGLGNPLYFQISGGNVHDSVLAIEVLECIEIEGSNIIGDRAYGSIDIISYVIEHQATYTIPPKKNTREPWTIDWWLYKERHLIECFFNKLKHFRHIATRYDKLAKSYLAFVHIAAIFILTK